MDTQGGSPAYDLNPNLVYIQTLNCLTADIRIDEGLCYWTGQRPSRTLRVVWQKASKIIAEVGIVVVQWKTVAQAVVRRKRRLTEYPVPYGHHDLGFVTMSCLPVM